MRISNPGVCMLLVVILFCASVRDLNHTGCKKNKSMGAKHENHTSSCRVEAITGDMVLFPNKNGKHMGKKPQQACIAVESPLFFAADSSVAKGLPEQAQRKKQTAHSTLASVAHHTVAPLFPKHGHIPAGYCRWLQYRRSKERFSR